MKTRRVDIGFGTGFTGASRRISGRERTRAMRAILTEASKQFGGCFLTQGHGGWIDDSGRLIEEPGAIARIYTDASHDTVRAFARFVLWRLAQTEVLLDDNGTLEHVRAIAGATVAA